METEINSVEQAVEAAKKLVQDSVETKEEEVEVETKETTEESVETKTEGENNETNLDTNTEPEKNDKIETEETKTVETTEKTDETVFTPVEIKDRGFKIVVDKMEDLVTLAHKGLNYENKKKELAEARDIHTFLNENQLSKEDLQTLIDAKKGNKAAILSLAQNAGVDIYDIDAEAKYTPQPANIKNNEIAETISEIQSDTELFGEVSNILRVSPKEFSQTISSDPQLLRHFAFGDVKTGIAQKAIPEAIKSYAINPAKYPNGFLDAYVEASLKIVNTAPKPQVESKKEDKVDELKRQKALLDKENNNVSQEKPFEDYEKEVYSKKDITPEDIVELAKRRVQKMKATIKG
jgi:hypothetical protein